MIQAFPQQGFVNEKTGVSFIGAEGMTLRDYFAGQALSGIMRWVTEGKPMETTARESYAVADAMLKAREVENEV